MPDARPVLPPVSDWQPMQLQLIVFPVHPQLRGEDQLWKAVTGSEPTDVKRQGTQRAAEGEYEGRSLSVIVDIQRVIWTVTPIIDLTADLPLSSIPTLAAYPAARDWFAGLMGGWLRSEACPAIRRLAFAGRLFMPTANREASYDLLGRYLAPSVQVSASSHDFLYQINRRRDLSFGAESVEVNRLAKWSAMSVALKLRATSGADHPETQVQVAFSYGSLLEVDINTDAERTAELSRESIADGFARLVEFATGIAESGDEP